jgi:hypothetical protein
MLQHKKHIIPTNIISAAYFMNQLINPLSLRANRKFHILTTTKNIRIVFLISTFFYFCKLTFLRLWLRIK